MVEWCPPFHSLLVGASIGPLRNTMPSPNVTGAWLRAVRSLSTLDPNPTAFKLPLFTYFPGNIRALPKVTKEMIIKNALSQVENNPLLIYFSSWNLKPTEVTGRIYLPFPTNTLNPQTLLDVISLPLTIQKDLTGNPVGLSKEQHYNKTGFHLFCACPVVVPNFFLWTEGFGMEGIMIRNPSHPLRFNN